jgi:flavodoxin
MTQTLTAGKAGPKVLVVYYSRTQTTHNIALDIAQELGADIERITDQKDRTGFVGYMSSGKEATKKVLVDIDMPQKDPANYDLVIVGTPVWAWTMCSPVRTYLTRYGPMMAKVAFFCTADGNEKLTIDDMAQIVGKPGEARLVVFKKERKKGTAASKVLEFVSKLKMPQVQAPA